MTTLDTMHTIEPGDFVASTTLSQFTGFVIGPGTLGTRYPGWRVLQANGTEEIFTAGDCRLVHKNLEWWDRHCAEIANGTIIPVFQEQPA